MKETPEITERVENLEIYSRYVPSERRYGFAITCQEDLNQNLQILQKMFKLAMGEDDGIWPDEADIEQTHENEPDLE